MRRFRGGRRRSFSSRRRNVGHFRKHRRANRLNAPRISRGGFRL